MKKLRLAVFMLVIALCISGCSLIGSSSDTPSTTTKPVHDIIYSNIFVDYETNVMYAWHKSGYGAGMSVMLNADGSPKLYDKSTSKYANNITDIIYTDIFVDYETNVMYTWHKSGYGAGMSVMLNADGSPKLYDKSTSKYVNNISDIVYTTIFVDYETNVMYTWHKSGYGAGMSVMLNADGSPKLYDKSTSKYVNNISYIVYTNIFVDYESNVMYTWYKSGYGAGMSVMLNADGTPKLYN